MSNSDCRDRCDQELARLTAAMAQSQPQWTWRVLRIADAADVRYVGHTVQIPLHVLHSPAAYAGRFDDHLRAGHSWINLHSAGIVEDALIVIVEVPQYPGGAPADQVAVNLSGPATGVRVEFIDACGRTMLAPAVIDLILHAFDEWSAPATDLAQKSEQLLELTQRLLQLTTIADVPASAATDISHWHDQLYAAWKWWARDGDIRGLAPADAIISAMTAWAAELRIDFKPDTAPG